MALLKAMKFDEVAKCVPNKIADLLDCEPITTLIGEAGEKTVQMYVEAELIKLAANFNGNPTLNLKDYQVPIIAEMLIQNYKWESVEDFTLCFRRASCGFYGEIYRIDGAVIGQWMARYLEEKYDALEQRKAKEKDKRPAVIESNPNRNFLAAMETALGGKDIEIDLAKYLTPEQIKEVEQARKRGLPKEPTTEEKREMKPYIPELSIEHKRKILKQEFPNASDSDIDKLLEKIKT